MTPRYLALCALTLFVPAHVANDLEYRPDPETSWQLTFEEKNVFELESMVQTVGGTEVSGPTPEMTGTISRQIEVTDQVRKVAGGRALDRHRTFEEIESGCELTVAVMGEEQSYELSFTSELAEEELSVRWDDETEEHEFEFVDDESPEASLLDGLIEDLDYQLLLPPEDVEEGGSWELDLDEARALFSPGGDLHMLPEETPVVGGGIIEAHDLVAIASMSLAEASGSASGRLTATWAETVEAGDAKLAVIALELEAEFEADQSESIQDMATSVGLPPRQDYRFESAWEVEGRGQLRWDLEAGHFHDLELELETIVEISLGFSESFGDIEVEVETSGTTTMRAGATKL